MPRKQEKKRRQPQSIGDFRRKIKRLKYQAQQHEAQELFLPSLQALEEKVRCVSDAEWQRLSPDAYSDLQQIEEALNKYSDNLTLMRLGHTVLARGLACALTFIAAMIFAHQVAHAGLFSPPLNSSFGAFAVLTFLMTGFGLVLPNLVLTWFFKYRWKKLVLRIESGTVAANHTPDYATAGRQYQIFAYGLPFLLALPFNLWILYPLISPFFTGKLSWINFFGGTTLSAILNLYAIVSLLRSAYKWLNRQSRREYSD